jgi:hypothetical protein
MCCLSFWPLCCLFFFDIQFLIDPLVSSNSSCFDWLCFDDVLFTLFWLVMFCWCVVYFILIGYVVLMCCLLCFDWLCFVDVLYTLFLIGYVLLMCYILCFDWLCFVDVLFTLFCWCGLFWLVMFCWCVVYTLLWLVMVCWCVIYFVLIGYVLLMCCLLCFDWLCFVDVLYTLFLIGYILLIWFVLIGYVLLMCCLLCFDWICYVDVLCTLFWFLIILWTSIYRIPSNLILFLESLFELVHF